LNLARVELIDQIDTWVEDRIRFDSSLSLHTETLGQLTDRLAVAWVRSRRMVDLSHRRPGGQEDARRALALLTQLCDAYDDLVRDLREGRRRLPAWRSLKRYGTER
jgi:hypothetical protein